MAMNYKIPKFPFNIPFFMFDLSNYQLITTPTIPSDILDTKDVVLTELPVPGLNFNPIQIGGGGNRKISFTLPLIRRNNTIGNVMILKQFDQLRNQATGFTGIFSSQFLPNPKVLFYYGVGSIPLIYFVKKCDASHKQGWINEMGYPQYSEISIELWLDENSTIYKGEEIFRKLMAMTGQVDGLSNVIRSQQSKKYNPY
jgi:hypothetical protein